MTPTCKLRFVERIVYVPITTHNYYGDVGTVSEAKKIRVLQQWVQGYESGEWKDVPLEEEK